MPQRGAPRKMRRRAAPARRMLLRFGSGRTESKTLGHQPPSKENKKTSERPSRIGR